MREASWNAAFCGLDKLVRCLLDLPKKRVFSRRRSNPKVTGARVRAEGRRRDAILMSEAGEFLARRRVPEPGGLVVRRRRDLRPVRAEDRRPDAILMGEPGELLARLCVPEPGGLVVRHRHDLRPVRAEGRRPDALLMGEAGELLPCLCVPEPGGVVARRRRDLRPVRAEDRRPDAILMSEAGELLPVFASQSRAVLSRDAVTIFAPSGLKAAA